MANLQNLKPFQKGNPGGPGRPKLTEEQKTAKALARERVGKAFARIDQILDSEDEHAALKAATAIIDRAEGKPKQEIEATGKGFIVPVINVSSTAERARDGLPSETA